MSKLSKLHHLIINHLDKHELQLICDDFFMEYPELDFNYGDIPEHSHFEEKTQKVLQKLKEIGALKEFEYFLYQKRPDLHKTSIFPLILIVFGYGIGLVILLYLFLWLQNVNKSKSNPLLSSAPTSTPAPTPTPRFVLPTGQEVKMMFVREGTFLMGSDDYDKDERPVHEMFVDSFWLDLTEVTNEQFALFVADTGYITTAEEEGKSYTWQHPFGSNSSIEGQEQHPVVQVSWYDAVAFCAWREAKLPTEAQWEKAAGWNPVKQEAFVYPWGDYSYEGNANCYYSCHDGIDGTASVGSFSPDGDSPYGLQDMAGNVWEWTNSYYTDSYSADAQEYHNRYVLRGGSWDYDVNELRSSARNWYRPEYHFNYLGFRCASE